MKATLVLCACLHIILVLIYVTILVLVKAGVFNAPLNLSEDAARTIVTFVTQGFTIAYCAALAFFAQRVALCEIISGQQTLSAMHDKSTAWLGLASALSVMSDQRKIATDVVGILIITVYLACILVVHTTLPGTFNLAVVNVIVDTTYPTTLARQPNVSDSFSPSQSPLHSILSIYDTLNITTVGVQDNIVYDIIPIVSDTANAAVAVNAMTISVDCGIIPDIIQKAFKVDGSVISPSQIVEDNPAYELTFGGGKYEASINPMGSGALQVVAPITTSSESVLGDILQDVNPSMLLVVPTLTFQDSSITVPRVEVNIDPPWQEPGDNVTTSLNNILGCNFAIENSTAQVNAQTREITKSATDSASVTLHNWTDPGISSDPLLAQTLMFFAAFAPLDPSSSGLNPITVLTDTANLTVPFSVTMLDEFLFSDLVSNAKSSGASEVTVADLSHSLAKAYAAVLWYYNVINPAGVASNQIQADRQRGTAVVPTLASQVRIAINMLSLSIGLGASCILLVLVFILIFRTRHHRGQHNTLIGSTGLLPMLWLLNNEPRLMDVQEPDLDAMRAAGMYEVSTIKARRRARSLASGSIQMGKSSEQLEVYTPLTQLASRQPGASFIREL